MYATLDQVAVAFDSWRAQRSKRSRIPKELIAQAIDVSTRYNKSEIIRRLRINHAMLTRWVKEQPADNLFIPLPTNNTQEIALAESCSLEISIKFVNGAQLTLAGTTSDTATFISELQQREAL